MSEAPGGETAVVSDVTKSELDVAALVVERDLHRFRALEESSRASALHFELDALRAENARLRAVLGDSRPQTPSGASAAILGSGAPAARSRAGSAVSAMADGGCSDSPTRFLAAVGVDEPNSPHALVPSPTGQAACDSRRASFRSSIVPFSRPHLQQLETNTDKLMQRAPTARAPTSLLSSFFKSTGVAADRTGAAANDKITRRARANTAPQPVSPSRTKPTSAVPEKTRPRASSHSSLDTSTADVASDGNSGDAAAIASFMEVTASASSVTGSDAQALPLTVPSNSDESSGASAAPSSSSVRNFLSAFVAPRLQTASASGRTSDAALVVAPAAVATSSTLSASSAVVIPPQSTPAVSASGTSRAGWSSWFSGVSSAASSSTAQTPALPSSSSGGVAERAARARSQSLPRSVSSPQMDTLGVFVDASAADALSALANDGVNCAADALADALARDAALPRTDALLLSKAFHSVPRFASLNARERAVLAGAFSRVHHAQGEVVIQERRVEGFYFIVEGRLSTDSPSGESFSPGDCFSSDALPADARVVAASTDVTLLMIKSPLLSAMLAWFEHAREIEQKAVAGDSHKVAAPAGGAPGHTALPAPPALPPARANESPLSRLRLGVAAATDFASYSAALRRYAGAAHALSLPADSTPRGGAAPAGSREVEQAMRDLEREHCIFLQGTAIMLGGRDTAARFLQELAGAVRTQIATDADFCEALLSSRKTRGSVGRSANEADSLDAIESAREAAVATIVADIAVGVSRTVHGGDSFVAAHELLTRGGLVFLAAETGAQPPAEILIRGSRASITAVNVYRAAHMETSGDAQSDGDAANSANAGVSIWARLRCTVREEIHYSFEDSKKLAAGPAATATTREPIPPPQPPPTVFAFSGFFRGFSKGSDAAVAKSITPDLPVIEPAMAPGDVVLPTAAISEQSDATAADSVAAVAPREAEGAAMPASNQELPTPEVEERIVQLKASSLRWLDIIARVCNVPEKG